MKEIDHGSISELSEKSTPARPIGLFRPHRRTARRIAPQAVLRGARACVAGAAVPDAVGAGRRIGGAGLVAGLALRCGCRSRHRSGLGLVAYVLACVIRPLGERPYAADVLEVVALFAAVDIVDGVATADRRAGHPGPDSAADLRTNRARGRCP